MKVNLFRIKYLFHSFLSGITIQRARDFESVCCQYRQRKRSNNIWNDEPTLLRKHLGIITLEDLIDWLYESDELNKRYDVGMSNCQHFSEALFKKVSKNFGFRSKFYNQSKMILDNISAYIQSRHYNSCNICDRRYIHNQIKLLLAPEEIKHLVKAGAGIAQLEGPEYL